MIPVSLTLKGLYSYQHEQTIEFDRLVEGQLFGIFGAVGSGKSSILEAISFALYGQTERLDNRDNRNYNMMNLKSNELLIDFTFRNFDKHLYRFTVKGKRHGKDFEKVNTFDRASYKRIKDEWHPMESSLAEPIIGLSYDNFRRTIIIPQGKFQEFLQLGNSHRTQMLKEIFQLDKYEFFNQTKNIESKNNSSLQHLKGQISIYADIQAEKIAEKSAELESLAVQLKNQTDDFDRKSGLLQDLLKLKSLFKNLNAQKEIVSNLQEREAFFNELEGRIKNLEYCIIHFENGLDRLSELKDGIAAKELSLTQTQTFQDEMTKEIKSLNELLKESTNEYLKQDVYKEKLQDYHHLISLVKLKSDSYKLQERIEKGEILTNGLLTKKIDTENKLALIKKELREKNDLKPNMRELIDLRAWFDRSNSLEEVLRSAILEKDRLKNEAIDLQDGLLSLINDYNCFEKVEEVLLEELNEQLIKLRADKALEVRSQRDEIEHFQVQLKLSEFTDALKRGEACPLCGSLEHKFVLEVENVQLHLQNAQVLNKKLESEYTIFQDLANELQLYSKKNDFINDQIVHAQKKIDECKENLLKHRSIFKWENFDLESHNQVIEQINEATLLETVIRDLEKKQEEYQEYLIALSKDYDRYNESLDRLKNDFKAAVTESSILTKQLKHQDADSLAFSESELKTLLEELSLKITTDKERYDHLNNSLIKLKEQELRLSVQIESLTIGLKAEKDSLIKAKYLLEEKLKVSPFDNWENIRSILNEKIDLNKEKEQLSNYKLQLYSAKDSLNELISQTVGKSFNQSEYDGLFIECNVLKEEITNLNDQYISEKSVHDGWVSQLAAKNKLLKELKKLEARHENIKTMRQLFMANGFVNYISTVYLQNLCHVANERFYRLTRQQLRLELGDKNEFLVRDFMNDGKLRSVKTLSGGQTFQASLCLALALAESVQHQNKSDQNFFFLDEGFGSLDKESLQMAFETLKALRKENRIVGIISHVEELQQEIDIYLKVINDTFAGSLITKSWKHH